jgi:hypothetical protein
MTSNSAIRGGFLAFSLLSNNYVQDFWIAVDLVPVLSSRMIRSTYFSPRMVGQRRGVYFRWLTNLKTTSRNSYRLNLIKFSVGTKCPHKG